MALKKNKGIKKTNMAAKDKQRKINRLLSKNRESDKRQVIYEL